MVTKAFSLALASEGARVRIAGFAADHALHLRLTELGLNVGSELHIAQSEGGQMVVVRGETRLALGIGLVHRILVTPVTCAGSDRRGA